MEIALAQDIMALCLSQTQERSHTSPPLFSTGSHVVWPMKTPFAIIRRTVTSRMGTNMYLYIYIYTTQKGAL